jgi:hypothetical protein
MEQDNAGGSGDYTKDEEKERCIDLIMRIAQQPREVSMIIYQYQRRGPRMYVLGGRGLASVDMYDCLTGEWNATTLMQIERSQFGACCVGDSNVYAGGWSGAGPVASVEKLNDRVPGGAWAFVAPMSIPQYLHGVCALDGFVYAIGGTHPETKQAMASVERYSPDTNEWTTVKPMQVARYSHAVCVLVGCLFAVGGYNIATVEKYDVVTDQWSFVAALPDIRSSHAVAVLDNHIYVMGGYDHEGMTSVLRADAAVDVWVAVSGLKFSRKCVCAGVLNGRLMAVGGWQEQSIEVYDELNDAWSDAQLAMPSVRLEFYVAIFPNVKNTSLAVMELDTSSAATKEELAALDSSDDINGEVSAVDAEVTALDASDDDDNSGDEAGGESKGRRDTQNYRIR